MRTADFLDWAESVWPASSAEAWDNPGLISGSLEQSHSRALATIDITNDVLDEAINADCSLIIAHHPLLLGGIETLRQDTYKGKLLAKAIKNDIALFSAHTNADVAVDGVSDLLANKLGIENVMALDGTDVGHGRIGTIRPQSLLALLENIKAQIPKTAKGIAYIGDPGSTIETVALVAGSGIGFANEIKADVFITSDIKHHPALDLKEQAKIGGISALVDISHFAAESIWLEGLVRQLSTIGLEALVSKTNTDPWDGVLI